ncbi:perforin-1-like isoform X2 [Dendropsophus ebraccatus]
MASKLCLMFWLLLLQYQRPSMSSPILRAGCRPGTPQECKETKFVPGHTLVGEGLNIVTMKTTGTFLLDLQEVGEKCTVCDNPHNNNALQKVPKAMVDWRPENSCTKNVQSSVSRSDVSIADEATSIVQNDWKVGLNLNINAVKVRTAVGGSHSPMAQFANSKIVTDDYSFLSHKLECSFYSFGLGSNASLTSHFQESLDKLPDCYDDKAKDQYRRLIENFGTHYITQVKVGGRTEEVTAVRTCQLAVDGLKMDEVKDCLSVEAELGISNLGKSGSIDSKVEHCKKKLMQARLGGSFHQIFKDRVWKVNGGNATFDLLSANKAMADVFANWMESLKTSPGLVSYSLDPIHNLVRMKGSKKEYLKQTIIDYIKEKALIEKCSCPGRHVGNDCSCTCRASKYTNSDCCPTHRGAAKLHVTIKSGTGLKGDFLSETDAYVMFKFDGDEIRTPTIWNKNNPTWDEKFDVGLVELREGKKYTIEVWDEDRRSDDFLGKCQKVLTSNEIYDTCYLKRGSVTYSLNVTCVDHLQGMFCQDYIPVPPSL